MKKTEKRKKRRSSHGVITVFVTLIMVPVVAITGIMVDVSRLKMYSSQAAMAADSYGDAVLSEFDNLLKQLYGLFSVTQNEEGLEAIEKLAEYASYSFNPDKDEKGFSGFMPYKDADVELVYEKVLDASLSNNNVLMTQISDFMKYRIAEQVIDELGILDSLDKFDSMAPDTEAMEERSDITDSSSEALIKIAEYYNELNKLAKYPSYLDERADAYEAYSKKLKDIVTSDDYEDYVYYLEHAEEIEEAIEAVESYDDEEDSDDEDDDSGSSDEPSDEQLELYERFCNFKVDDYKEKLDEDLSELSKKGKDYDSDPIDFDNTESIIQALGKKADEVDGVLQTIEEQISSLEAKLVDCSDEVKTGITEEIKDLKTLSNYRRMFKETYQWIAVTKNCEDLNSANKEILEEGVKNLDQIKDDILSGDQEAEEERSKCPWNDSVPVAWADFQDDGEMNKFYNELKELCGSDGSDKKAGEKETQKANDAQEKAEKELQEDEKTDARDITSGLASQLGSGGSDSGEVPSLTSYFAGGLSFKAMADAGSHILDKFLLTSYDFGMFSSRVTGIEPKEDSLLDKVTPGKPDSDGVSLEKPVSGGVNLDKSEKGDSGSDGGDSKPGSSGGSYTDYSLTKIEMSPDVNYLYGAELEYLFGGHNKSVSNLNETRNIICGVRMTFNFASTYTIKEVNTAIQAIAAAAAAASGPAAPLVRVAVSGALRMAVAAIETAADWSALKNREDVILIKMDVADLQSADALKELLPELETKSGGTSTSWSSKIKMSYEDYLYILLCLLVDDNTLLSRTANLITLNVNQAVNDGDTLTNLDFKMADTITAIKSTCKVKADFVIVPENFAHMYYSNTSTESIIEALEDNYFGYCVIRGY